MTRRIPILPTIVVLVAVAVLVRLGIWQLHREDQHQAQIATYARAQQQPAAVPWPQAGDKAAIEQALFRRSAFTCDAVISRRDIAGRSAANKPGWAHMATCKLAGGGTAEVALGWSKQPETPAWSGGAVTGYVAPAGDYVRLVAWPAQAGLAQLRKPDPRDLPDSHMFYAAQWFFFALVALVVYALALRKRWRTPPPA